MFKEEGYFKEYWINGKYLGTINRVEKDREIMGFYGQKIETLTEDLTLSNKRKLKKGTIVKTQLHLICSTKTT